MAGRAQGLLLAVASGVLYGSVNVAAKMLGAHPLWSASLAYLAGAVLLLPATLRLRVPRRDWPKVLAMGLVGGGLSPALLFWGLQHATAVDAGLLLTAELAATALLAVAFLGEREGPRGWTGIGLLALAAVGVAVAGSRAGATTPLGATLVLLAAVGWGLDNAVSARLVARQPVLGLLGAKAWLGGLATGAVAVASGARLPEAGTAGGLAIVGAVGITLSSACYYVALRRIGAARTSALNVPTTAIVGAVAGVVLLSEPLTAWRGAALASGVAGVLLLARQAPTAAGPA